MRPTLIALTLLIAGLGAFAQARPPFENQAIPLKDKVLLDSNFVTGQARALDKFVWKPEEAKKFTIDRLDTKLDGPLNTNATIDYVKNHPIELLPRLSIKQLDAERNGARINLLGVVSNPSDQAIPFGYKFSKWNGSFWTLLANGGTRLVQAKTSMNVQTDIPATNDALGLKLELLGETYVSKEFNLAAKIPVFIVRYTTSGNWVLAREYDNDLSDGFDATQLASTRLQPVGLETRIVKKRTTVFGTPLSINTKIHTWLYFGTEDALERTFDNRSEAVKFHNMLISLVKDKGLTVEDVREQ